MIAKDVLLITDAGVATIEGLPDKALPFQGRKVTAADIRGKKHAAVVDDKDVHQVGTHPDYPDIVHAATARGFYISTSKGDTFEKKTGNMPYYYQRACAVLPGTTIYLCSTSRGPHGQADALLFRSADGGGEWKMVSGLPTGIVDNVDTYQIKIVDEDTAYTVVNNNSVWLTNDTGQSWSLLADDLPRVYGFMALPA